MIIKKLLLPLLLLLSAPAWAAPALVQSTAVNGFTVTTKTVTLNSVASGDLLVLQVSYNSAEALSSVTDSNGSPQAAVSESSTNEALSIYYVPNTASGTHTFTVTVPAATSFELLAEEFSGAETSAPLDGTMPTVNTGDSATPASNSVTPSQSGDLAITALTVEGPSESFSSWTNGFVFGNKDNGNLAAAWAYQVYNSIAPLTGGVTTSVVNNYGMGIVLFKPSSGSGSCTHSGITSGGAISVPNGVSGSYRLKNGSFGTPDCATVSYFQTRGAFGVN